jgi:hypothetical protein
MFAEMKIIIFWIVFVVEKVGIGKFIDQIYVLIHVLHLHLDIPVW